MDQKGGKPKPKGQRNQVGTPSPRGKSAGRLHSPDHCHDGTSRDSPAIVLSPRSGRPKSPAVSPLFRPQLKPPSARKVTAVSPQPRLKSSRPKSPSPNPFSPKTAGARTVTPSALLPTSKGAKVSSPSNSSTGPSKTSTAAPSIAQRQAPARSSSPTHRSGSPVTYSVFGGKSACGEILQKSPPTSPKRRLSRVSVFERLARGSLVKKPDTTPLPDDPRPKSPTRPSPRSTRSPSSGRQMVNPLSHLSAEASGHKGMRLSGNGKASKAPPPYASQGEGDGDASLPPGYHETLMVVSELCPWIEEDDSSANHDYPGQSRRSKSPPDISNASPPIYSQQDSVWSPSTKSPPSTPSTPATTSTTKPTSSRRSISSSSRQSQRATSTKGDPTPRPNTPQSYGALPPPAYQSPDQPKSRGSHTREDASRAAPMGQSRLSSPRPSYPLRAPTRMESTAPRRASTQPNGKERGQVQGAPRRAARSSVTSSSECLGTKRRSVSSQKVRDPGHGVLRVDSGISPGTPSNAGNSPDRKKLQRHTPRVRGSPEPSNLKSKRSLIANPLDSGHTKGHPTIQQAHAWGSPSHGPSHGLSHGLSHGESPVTKHFPGGSASRIDPNAYLIVAAAAKKLAQAAKHLQGMALDEAYSPTKSKALDAASNIAEVQDMLDAVSGQSPSHAQEPSPSLIWSEVVAQRKCLQAMLAQVQGVLSVVNPAELSPRPARDADMVTSSPRPHHVINPAESSPTPHHVGSPAVGVPTRDGDMATPAAGEQTRDGDTPGMVRDEKGHIPGMVTSSPTPHHVGSPAAGAQTRDEDMVTSSTVPHHVGDEDMVSAEVGVSESTHTREGDVARAYEGSPRGRPPAVRIQIEEGDGQCLSGGQPLVMETSPRPDGMEPTAAKVPRLQCPPVLSQEDFGEMSIELASTPHSTQTKSDQVQNPTTRDPITDSTKLLSLDRTSNANDNESGTIPKSAPMESGTMPRDAHIESETMLRDASMEPGAMPRDCQQILHSRSESLTLGLDPFTVPRDGAATESEPEGCGIDVASPSTGGSTHSAFKALAPILPANPFDEIESTQSSSTQANTWFDVKSPNSPPTTHDLAIDLTILDQGVKDPPQYEQAPQYEQVTPTGWGVLQQQLERLDSEKGLAPKPARSPGESLRKGSEGSEQEGAKDKIKDKIKDKNRWADGKHISSFEKEKGMEKIQNAGALKMRSRESSIEIEQQMRRNRSPRTNIMVIPVSGIELRKKGSPTNTVSLTRSSLATCRSPREHASSIKSSKRSVTWVDDNESMLSSVASCPFSPPSPCRSISPIPMARDAKSNHSKSSSKGRKPEACARIDTFQKPSLVGGTLVITHVHGKTKDHRPRPSHFVMEDSTNESDDSEEDGGLHESQSMKESMPDRGDELQSIDAEKLTSPEEQTRQLDEEVRAMALSKVKQWMDHTLEKTYPNDTHFAMLSKSMAISHSQSTPAPNGASNAPPTVAIENGNERVGGSPTTMEWYKELGDRIKMRQPSATMPTGKSIEDVQNTEASKRRVLKDLERIGWERLQDKVEGNLQEMLGDRK